MLYTIYQEITSTPKVELQIKQFPISLDSRGHSDASAYNGVFSALVGFMVQETP